MVGSFISLTGYENMVNSKEKLSMIKKIEVYRDGFLCCDKCLTSNLKKDYYIVKKTINYLPDTQLICGDCIK